MRRVFSKMRYVVLTTAIALLVFCAIAWADALPLFVRVLTDLDLTLPDALELGAVLLIISLFDFTPLGFLYAGLSAILIGINAALLLFYVRFYRAVPPAAASGILGGTIALLGFGCAACGSIFIISFFTALGGTSLLALLPHHGSEIGYFGIALLMTSALLLARAISRPPTCPI